MRPGRCRRGRSSRCSRRCTGCSGPTRRRVAMRLRTALVTARSAPAHERAIRTLMDWNISIDEAMFLGGLDKGPFLREFEPDFYFDDQTRHVDSASRHVPVGPRAARHRERVAAAGPRTGRRAPRPGTPPSAFARDDDRRRDRDATTSRAPTAARCGTRAATRARTAPTPAARAQARTRPTTTVRERPRHAAQCRIAPRTRRRARTGRACGTRACVRARRRRAVDQPARQPGVEHGERSGGDHDAREGIPAHMRQRDDGLGRAARRPVICSGRADRRRPRPPVPRR